METIRIYPTTIYNRFKALIIDGRTYLGVESAIQNYLKENGIKIADVKWKVKDKEIVAIDIDDFMKQFNKLCVDF